LVYKLCLYGIVAMMVALAVVCVAFSYHAMPWWVWIAIGVFYFGALLVLNEVAKMNEQEVEVEGGEAEGGR
jgi:hypothetical protein